MLYLGHCIEWFRDLDTKKTGVSEELRNQVLDKRMEENGQRK